MSEVGETASADQQKLLEEEDLAIIKEYEDIRRREREEEEAELEAMRVRIQKKRKEREEEDARIREQRRIEEEHWKQVEEERKRKKEEEERRKKEEKERILREAEKAAKMKGKRNFKVKRKPRSDAVVKDITGIGSVLAGAEDLEKTKEEMEEEKLAIMANRVKPFELAEEEEEIREQLREMHARWLRVESERYDMDQQYKRQQYDYMELAERARQMKFGGSKRGGIARDEEFDREHDRFQQAPPPVLVASRYERNQDKRKFIDKIHTFDKAASEVPQDEELVQDEEKTSDEEQEYYG